MKCGSVRSGCPQCPFGGWVGGEGRSEGRGWWREAVVAAAAAIKSHPESSTLATCSFSKGCTSSPNWEFLTDELSGPQAPWIAEMLLGPVCRFCYSLANVSSPSFLLVIPLIMRTTVNNISWKGALLACFIRSRSPSRDRRQEALQHVEERRERERRQVTRTRFSIYFSSPHLSPLWVDKPPLCVLLKSPRLRMAGGLRTWVYACWLKAFMHASPWGNTWCWWDRDVCCGEKGWQGKKRWGTWGLGGEDEKGDVCVVL